MRLEAITWTNDDLLPIGRIETNTSVKFRSKCIHFIQENLFENIVSTNVGIFSAPMHNDHNPVQLEFVWSGSHITPPELCT